MQRPVNSAVKTREEHAQQAIRSRVLAQHMPHVHWMCPFPTSLIGTRNKAHTKSPVPAICTGSSVPSTAIVWHLTYVRMHPVLLHCECIG